MRHSAPLRLRETPSAAPPGARVIDAQFEIVAGKRRGVLGHVWMACVAVFWAALIGILIPPAWMFAQSLLGN